MKLTPLLVCALSAATGRQARLRDITVVGFVHSVYWLDQRSDKVTAEVQGAPVLAPNVFGPRRTTWNLWSEDETGKTPFQLTRSNPNGRVESWSLTLKRLKELHVSPTGRYDNTHEDYYSGASAPRKPWGPTPCSRESDMERSSGPSALSS